MSKYGLEEEKLKEGKNWGKTKRTKRILGKERLKK